MQLHESVHKKLIVTQTHPGEWCTPTPTQQKVSIKFTGFEPHIIFPSCEITQNRMLCQKLYDTMQLDDCRQVARALNVSIATIVEAL